MRKGLIKSLAVLSIALFIVIYGKMPDTVFAATPKNQNFDTTAASSGINSMKFDGLTYTTNNNNEIDFMQVMGYQGCFIDYSQANSAYFMGNILTNDGFCSAAPTFLQIESTDAGNNFNLSSMYCLASDMGDGHVINIEGYNGNTKVYSITGINLGATGSYSTGALNGESVSISNVISTTNNEYGGLLTFTGWNDFDTIRIKNNAGDTKTLYAAIDSLTFSNVVDISVNDVTVNEDAKTATFTVSLSKTYSSDITVGYSTEDDTAVSASDYTSETGTVTIPKNTTTVPIIVPITEDDVYEANESFYLNLTSTSIGGFTDSQGIGTISNNDNPPAVTLSASGSSFSEAGEETVITATLSNKSYQDVTVTLGLSGTAVNGTDYSVTGTQIVILAGSQSGTITVTSTEDTDYEGDETIIAGITAVNNGSEDGTQQVTTTLTDNDSKPKVALGVTGSPFSENGGTATIKATLSCKSYEDVTVTFGFTGAIAGTDYTATGTRITIPAGSLIGTITLTGVDNAVFSGDKTITVDISNVLNGTEDGTQHETATIAEDEAIPKVTLSLSDSSIAENDGTATITATSDSVSTYDITVRLTLTGTAVNNTDYALSDIITIPAGDQSGLITITGIDDTVYEVTETVIVDIGSVTGAMEDGQQTVTASITDDDAQPKVTLSSDKASLSENGGTAAITATLSNKSYQDVTVTLGLSGTAANGSDYTATGTEIVIPAGSLRGSITVTGTDDTDYEGDETVIADISSVDNGSVDGTQRVTTTLSENDSKPTVALSVAGSPFSENGGTATITATLSGKSYQAVTVTLGFTGTAAGTDYTATGTQITIQAGSLTGTITLTGVNNTVYSGDRTVVADITGVANATEKDTQQVSATISDDDPVPVVTLSIAESTLAENGGTVDITAELSSLSSQDITVNLAFTGTAVKDTDYSVSAASITIPAGGLSSTATITGISDTAYEAAETVIVDIDSVTGAIENAQQKVTASITDDDAQPKVTLSSDKASLSENGGTAAITATLSNKSYQAVTVSLGLSGTAANGIDYTTTGTEIVIPAGSLSGSITVTGTNDNAYEDTETIIAEIINVTNGTENSEQKLDISITDDEIIITGFDSITSINAGYAGSITYADAAAVTAVLPATVTANGGTVTIPVTAWTDTDGYNPSTAGSYTFTATLGTVPSGYANAGGYTATVEVVVTAITQITSFDAIANVNAGYAGSTVSGSAIIVKLPAAVTANGGTVTVPVTTWVDTDGYNPSAAGSYTFTATLGTLPSGYANAGGYTATVEVTVTAPGQLIFDPIANLNAGNAGNAAYTDSAAVAAALPDIVTVSGGAISVSVISWTDTDGYNPAVPGSYTFTAVLGAAPDGYTIGEVTLTAEVVVNAVTPDAPIVSVNDTTNKINGADSTMEYSADGGNTWTAYPVNADPVFEGKVTVLIRVAAKGGNPAGLTTSLSFTVNSTEPANNNPANPVETGSTGTSDKTKVTRKIDVNTGDGTGTAASTVATIDIVREVTGDKKIDTVVLDEEKTKEVLEKVIDQKQDLVQIVIDDIEDDQADEVSVTINNDSMEQLSESNKTLEVKTEEVSIQVPKETVKSLAQSEEDLYFRVVPIRNEATKEETIHNAITADIVMQTAGNSKIQAIGTPMTIETNCQNYMTKVIFSLKNVNIPSDEKERKELADSLAIYIKHSDGTEEINKGKFVYDKNGNPTDIEIEISKFSTFTMISIRNSVPTAANLTLSGKAKAGKKLAAAYIYRDAEDDKQGKSIIKWYRADSKNGKNKKQIKGVTGLTYKIRKADMGKYIIFEVTPVAKTGKTTGNASSVAIKIPDKSTEKTAASNTAPKASNVKITGKMKAGSKLTASYSYTDKENDKEGKSIFQWYCADSANGKNKEAISGADSLKYTLNKNDIGKYIIFEVTPIAKNGTKKGSKCYIITKTKVSEP